MPLALDGFRDFLDSAAIVSSSDAALRGAGVSSRRDPLRCSGLLRPRDTDEVSEILRRCHAVGQHVTVLGGMTGGGGFSLADELAISMERMTTIEEIDVEGRTAVVQAGCGLQALHEALAPLGLLYGVDYGGRGSATIGGNIATNAGGNQVMRYGMTRAQVLGLEAVLADGTVLSSMNRMLKNNAGYDLKQLFIGTEGTLGVVTRAVLRLHPAPLTRNTALVAFYDFGDVTRFLLLCERSFPGTLSAFEVMWREFYQGATRGRQTPLPDQFPFYALVEVQGASPKHDEAHFHAVLEDAITEGILGDVAIPSSEGQRDDLWGLREHVMWILETPSWYVFDISLPIPRMQRYVEELRRELSERWSRAELIVFGHIADGNLHVFVRFGDTQSAETYNLICEMAYGPLKPISGSMAAEHGVGRKKVAHLHYSRTASEIGAMKMLKRCLDPNNILNCGRIVAVDSGAQNEN